MSLKEAGADVVGPVGSALRAVELVSSTGIDVAILDINLGGGLDFELASQLAEREVPFIFATGYGSQAVPSRFAAVPLLEKPFSDVQLIREVCKMAKRPIPTAET